MTTKNKDLTNAMMAKRLGWECVDKGNNTIGPDQRPSLWVISGIYEERLPLPDLINDLNASRKYLYNAMQAILVRKCGASVDVLAVEYELAKIISDAWVEENPALYIAKAFIELEEKKKP